MKYFRVISSIVFWLVLAITLLLLISHSEKQNSDFIRRHGSEWPQRQFEVGDRVVSATSGDKGVVIHVSCRKFSEECWYEVDAGFKEKVTVRANQIRLDDSGAE